MSYYRSITIDHTKCGGADSTSFPVLIGGTYAWMATVANGGRVQSSSGYDIVFCTNYASPLTTKLPFERVVWNPATGACEFHVQVPTLSHTSDTVIYVYYGDSSVTTDQQNRHGTWDSNYVTVLHFGDGVTLNLTDSTSNSNNGTNSGTTPAAGIFGIGGSAHFTQSSSQSVTFSANSALQLGSQFTLEAQVNCDSLPGSGVFPGVICIAGSGDNHGLLLHDNSSSIANRFYGQTNNYNACPTNTSGNNAPTVGLAYQAGYSWLAGIGGHFYSNLSHSAFGDTVQRDDVGIIGPSNSSTQLYIGRWVGASYWDGYIDEVRISNVQRPNSWLQATFNTLSSPSTFYTVGAEQGGGGGSTFSPFLLMNNQVV